MIRIKPDFQYGKNGQNKYTNSYKTISYKNTASKNIQTKGKNGLQPRIFLLDSRPMSCHKSITILLSAAAIFLSSFGAARAIEQPPRLTDEQTLFERYTNSAQDLILKGLELVGINYRRGGTNPDTGLDCSGFVQVVFRDAVGKLLPRTAKEQSQVGDVVDKK